MNKTPTFGIVVGEKSGDILGADLIRALRQHFPDAKFVGVGGPEMLALGCESFTPMDRLSVMGFVEPFGRLPELLRLKKQIESHFIANPPAAFIGIDSPDFNLRIETNLRAQGIPTVHYVSPSVWAYREKRIHKIKRAVDLMLTLFPFETAIYDEHQVPAQCVGHPLADTIGFEDNKLEARAQFKLQANDEVVALMPGSRGGEIKRLAPTLFAAAIEALQDCPKLKFIIPYSGPEAQSQIQSLLRASNIFPSEQFTLVDDSHAAISAADLVVLSSGTATLEALLLRRPMVVCYKLAAFTYAIASRIVKIPHVALPNLLAGKELVPEYLQADMTVANIRDEIVKFMSGQNDHEALLKEFDTIHRSIRLDASARAAEAIIKLLSARAS